MEANDTLWRHLKGVADRQRRCIRDRHPIIGSSYLNIPAVDGPVQKYREEYLRSLDILNIPYLNKNYG